MTQELIEKKARSEMNKRQIYIELKKAELDVRSQILKEKDNIAKNTEKILLISFSLGAFISLFINSNIGGLIAFIAFIMCMPNMIKSMP